MSTYEIISLITLVLVTAQLGIVYMLARYIGNFVNKIQSIGGVKIGALEAGAKAPLFREFDHNNKKIILKDLITEKNTLLLFINSKCPSCKEILPELSRIISQYHLHIVVINSSNVSDDQEVIAKIPNSVIYIQSPHIADLFFLHRVPTAFIINQSGVIEQRSDLQDAKGLWNMLITQERIAS